MTTVMKSGNLLHYEHKDVPGRGGAFTARFSSPATEEDIAEGHAFLKSLVPRGGSVRLADTSHNEARHARIRDAFLTDLIGGSKN